MEVIDKTDSHLFDEESNVRQHVKANFLHTNDDKNPLTSHHGEVCLNDVTSVVRMAEADFMESSDELLHVNDMELRKPDTYSSILGTEDINISTSKCVNIEDDKLSFDEINESAGENMSDRIMDNSLENSEDLKFVSEHSGSENVSLGTEEVLDKIEDSENEDVKVKQESEAEEFTQIKRPKRRRHSNINYNENIPWDVDALYKAERRVNNQSRQCRKVKQQKVPDEKTKIIHSDSHFVDIFNNLYKLQKDGKYCDVKFCGSDGDVSAHSLVLISASPLLHKQFKQTIKKKSCVNGFTEIDFKDVPMFALQKIIAFLYTGSLEVAEKDSKTLSKHCKTLGLNALYKKLNSKHCSDESMILPEAILTDGRQKENASKIQNKSDLETLDVKDEKESLNMKSRKRKLKSEKCSKIKIKLPRQSLDLSELNTAEENCTIKVETPEKTSENSLINFANDVVENDDKIESSVLPEEKFAFDVDNDLEDDKEWNAEFSDNTESCIDNKTVKNKSRKSKLAKKGTKNEENKRLKKIENGKKMSNVKKKGKAQKSSTEILAESENKVAENDFNPIDSMVPESHINLEDNKFISEESQGKLSLEINSGNGGECEKCGKKFYFQYELTGHKNKCTGKNNRQRKKCVTCHVNFDSTEEYMEHRNSDVRCIKLRQEKLVKRKQKRFEMRRKYCCCACSRKFRRLADQIEHEFIAHEIQYDKEKWPDLYCEYCNYWSMNPWKLHHHKMVSCNKGQEPICDMCGNSYKNEKTLKKHKELMHTDVQPMLTCEECGKTLKGQKGLKHHIRLRHRGENLHNLMMCHICSQTYRTTSDLTFHLYKIHEQPLPEGFLVYRCPRCDYCHNNKRFFDKHMFLHEDKREWHCEVCSKAFKTKNSLSTHMIVHTSDRIPCPFDDCTYKALKNCHLKNHIENQHTQKGEKREKCHLCDYSTFFRGNLIKHQRSVHKLEVVTRHSVEMKARYKNLKSGQILGIKEDVISDKKSKNVDYTTTTSSVQESGFPVSTDTSMVENQCHYQDKSIHLPASQNVAESFVYTLVNAPVIQHHSNYPANPAASNMYRLPPIDFSIYNQNNTIDQI